MVELLIDKSYSTLEVVGRLEQAKRVPMVTKLFLCQVELNRTMIHALIDMFTVTSQPTNNPKHRIWEIIHFSGCLGPIHLLMPAIAKSNVREFQFCDDHDDDDITTIVASNSRLPQQQPQHNSLLSTIITTIPTTNTLLTSTSTTPTGTTTFDSSSSSSTTTITGSRPYLTSSIGNTTTATTQSIWGWVLSHPTLTKVTLGNLILSQDCATVIATALASNTVLQSFGLFSSVLLNDDAVTVLADGLRRNQHLKSIELSDCSLDDTQVEVIVSAISSSSSPLLATIDDGSLDDDHNDDDDGHENAIPDDDSHDSSVNDDGGIGSHGQLSSCWKLCSLVKPIDSSTITNRPATTKLERFHINGNYCGTNGTAAIARLLSQGDNTSHNCRSRRALALTTLDISDQLDAREFDQGIVLDITSTLLPALRIHPTLQTLNIRECNLGDVELQGLVNVLCVHPILQSLDVRYNRITPDGIKNIFAANLCHMKGLKRILLRQGWGILKEDVRDALIFGLKHNVCLTHLDLFEWVQEMEYYLDLNRTGRQLLQQCENTVVPRGLWPLLLERIPMTIEGRHHHMNNHRKYASATIVTTTQNPHNHPITTTQQQQQHHPFSHHHYYHHAMEKKGIRRMRKDAIRKASAYYYFLRQGPLLLER